MSDHFEDGDGSDYEMQEILDMLCKLSNKTGKTPERIIHDLIVRDFIDPGEDPPG